MAPAVQFQKPVSHGSLRRWVESEAGSDRFKLMAFAYSVVGVPLVGGLWWVGGSAPQLGALVVVLVLAVATLSLERFQTRLTLTYASGIAPAIVCGLAGDIAGSHSSAFATMLMCTVGLSSLHERLSTVVWAWLSCTIAWVVMLLPSGTGDATTVFILSWTYAVAAALLFAKAEQMRRLHRDVKEQAHAAQMAARAKTQFVAAMSHELRTPLNGVIGTAQLMFDSPLTLDQRESLQTIASSADWLLSTVTGVLEFAKAETGQMVIASSPYEPRALVEALVRLMAPVAHQKTLELLVDVEPGVPAMVTGDAFRVRQVVTQLVSNALKFTERGYARLSVRATEGGLEFAVQDTGIGIAETDLPRIFEPFAQADDGPRRRFDGMGLGLTLAREVVTRLEGRLSATSVVGAGSRFVFFVPGRDARAAEVAVPPLAGQICRVISRLPEGRESIERLLRGLGAQVAQAGEVSLVVLDVPVAQPLPWLATLPSSGQRTVALCPQGFQSSLELRRLGVVESVPKHQHRLVVCGLVKALTTPLVGPMQPALPPAQVVPIRPRAAAAGPVFKCVALIAEDNPVNAKVLVRLLEKFGVRAEVVIDGVSALKRVGETEFDAIFMDVNMPELDGVEATRILRASGFTRPIIAVTARSGSDDENECRQAGMTGFLSKPVDVKRLEEMVAQITQGPEAAEA